MSRTIEASRSAVNLKPVDRLEIVVLIDNKTDSLSSVPAGTTLEWTNLAKVGMKQIGGGCQYCANHGLALIVTAHRGDQKKTILFDAGPVEFAAEYNGKRLGTRFGEIDAVMLPHGHWDHAGGLPRALSKRILNDRIFPAISNTECFVRERCRCPVVGYSQFKTFQLRKT